MLASKMHKVILVTYLEGLGPRKKNAFEKRVMVDPIAPMNPWTISSKMIYLS